MPIASVSSATTVNNGAAQRPADRVPQIVRDGVKSVHARRGRAYGAGADIAAARAAPARRCAVLFLAQPMQRLLVDDAAVEHVDLAIRVVGVARIVRDDADRRAFGVQLGEQRHHLLAVLRVQVTRRLVGEQDRRAADERARDGDALLLTARELRRIVVQADAPCARARARRARASCAPRPSCRRGT